MFKLLVGDWIRCESQYRWVARGFRPGDVLTFDMYHPLTMMLMESHTSMVMTRNDKFVWTEAGRFDWGQMDVKEIVYGS